MIHPFLFFQPTPLHDSNIANPDQLASKPADLDLHCFLNREIILSWFMPILCPIPHEACLLYLALKYQDV